MDPQSTSTGKKSSRRHRRHRRKDDKSGSGKHSSRVSSQSHIRECACGRGLVCIGMTQAFRMLGDPRCFYVELPRFRKDPPAYKYVFRNNLREAYLRHLVRLNPDLDLSALETTQERRYVALHHFHPAVVTSFYENPLTKGAAQKHKVPISITEHELKELDLNINQEDRILSVTGKPTGGFYFCPGYGQDMAHEDLKMLIKKERKRRETSERLQSMEKPDVPENIEISKHSNSKIVTEDVERSSDAVILKNTQKDTSAIAHESDVKGSKDLVGIPESSSKPGGISGTTEDNISDAEANNDPERTEKDDEFDALWANENTEESRAADTIEALPFEFSNQQGDENLGELQPVVEDETLHDSSIDQVESDGQTSEPIMRSPSRDTDRPWHTPKYRRHLEDKEVTKRSGSSPAQFIDPTMSTSLQFTENNSKSHVDEIEPAEGQAIRQQNNVDEAEVILADKTPFAQKLTATLSEEDITNKKGKNHIDTLQPQILKSDPDTKELPIFRESQEGMSPSRVVHTQSKSWDSSDSIPTGTISLKHPMPGADPTIRIQVHNDLIAWESKRRTNVSEHVENISAWWQHLRKKLHEGDAEVEFAERFVSGFAKAGLLFANATDAVYEDKLLDDAGNTVNNSFLQNRLQKMRSTEEATIETRDTLTSNGHQSPLLTSILDVQVQMATKFRDASMYINEEILPELQEFLVELKSTSKQYENLGDSIIVELQRSEMELKNIWDVFDAMVTGDLMEYTVHGSLHGSMHGSMHGSQHGGSMHSMGQGTSSGGMRVGGAVGSIHSPAIKSTFQQLGAVEDGWLVEMYYRSAVTYQQAVFSIAENEMKNMAKRIVNLEERRARKLHEVLLAFVPRQRRLFNALPEYFKTALEDLVGLRIDEDSLQKLIDDSLKDRSRDRLKRGASHRSAIMNRSKVNKGNDTEEIELENLESMIGNPFKSPMVLLSKVVEFQRGGIRGMVNASWNPSLVVVTSGGNLMLFDLPEGTTSNGEATSISPFEAFQSLCPATDFDTISGWSRDVEITKPLIPSLIMSLIDCTFSVPKMQPRQVLISEEQRSAGSGRGNHFFKSMLGKKCTLRLSSANSVQDWIELLERTTKVLRNQQKNGL